MTDLPLLANKPAKSARGVFLATVEENPDAEDDKFRVVVVFNALGETIKRPARVVVPMAGGGRGGYFLPDKGEQVLVVFEQGDPSRPIVIGTAWSANRKPPETNQSGNNNTKLIRTPKGHRIIFCDKAGEEKLTIVDRTASNWIEIDSVAQKIKIQSSGDLKIVAKSTVIFHAQSVKIAIQDTLSGKASEVLAHAEQKFDVCGSGPVAIKKSIEVNIDQSPACKVTGKATGKVDGVSEQHVSESQQADTAKQVEKSKAAEAANREAMTQAAAAQAVAAKVDPAAAALAALQAQKPELPGAASLQDVTDALSLGQMAGIAALGAGVGAGIGAAVAFAGGKGAAGTAAAATAGVAAAASGAPSTSDVAAMGPEPAAASAPAMGSLAQDGGATPSTGDVVPRPGDASAPHSMDPRSGISRGGDVGSDVRGRASVTATASASGIDVETSSASSVFQEAAVSRATNPSQVPDVAVRSTQEVEDLKRRGDVEGEARSRVPATPLQPTPPVVEPRTAAANVAPTSIRSAEETQARVETASSDVRAAVSEPEPVTEAAARARAEEQLIDAGVRPMAVKGDLNTKEGTYGDPNMLARTQRDHEISLAEAEARLKVADAHVSETVSVSTDADPAPAVTTKPTDPKQPKPPKPEKP